MPRYWINGKAYFSDKELSPDEIDELTNSKNDPNKPINEPTTYLGGYVKGLNDYVGDLSRSLMEGMARPGWRLADGQLERKSGIETLGDLSTLVLPGVLNRNPLSIVRGALMPNDIIGELPGVVAKEPALAVKPQVTALMRLSDNPPPTPEEMPRKFASGPSGGTGQSVLVSEAEKNPAKYSKIIGSTGESSAPKGVNLGEVAEANRQKGLTYTAAEQEPGSRLKITDKGYELPPESGDTTGGFATQTEMNQWPYNVVPNMLRPRAAQSEVLGMTGANKVLGTPIKTLEGDIHFVSGSPSNPEFPVESYSSEKGYYGTGAPAEQLHPNRLEPKSEIIAPNKPLDIVNSSPKEVTDVEDVSKIPPGQAVEAPPVITQPNGKTNISNFRADFSSPHVIMENFPQTKGVIQPIFNANDDKYKWLATEMRGKLSEASKGLTLPDRKALTLILNGEEPGIRIGLNLVDDTELYNRAKIARKALDNIWGEAANYNKDMGFIDRYITHIAAQPEDIRSAVAAIVENNFGRKSPLWQIFSSEKPGEVTGTLGDLFERGLGKPDSPFTKVRTGALQDIELDYNKIIPTYLESMAKVIHDKPAVDMAKKALEDIPEGKLKNYLQAYIKNYTRYDASAALDDAWKKAANWIGTINARSVISFNPLVHMYHMGQLPANVWPELGTKYSLMGMKQFFDNPVRSYQEMARMGLFSNMIRPMQFQTKMQRFDSISYYMNAVESIVKGTSYYGLKAKFEAEGMSEAQAGLRALEQTKNITATVDPARNMKFYQNTEAHGATFLTTKLGKQYHQIPMKLVEQFVRAEADFKQNPAKAARYLAGSALAAGGSAVGLHTLHVNPLSMAKYAAGGIGQIGDVVNNIYRDLSKGDIGGALQEVVTWGTPGGVIVKKASKAISVD